MRPANDGVCPRVLWLPRQRHRWAQLRRREALSCSIRPNRQRESVENRDGSRAGDGIRQTEGRAKVTGGALCRVAPWHAVMYDEARVFLRVHMQTIMRPSLAYTRSHDPSADGCFAWVRMDVRNAVRPVAKKDEALIRGSTRPTMAALPRIMISVFFGLASCCLLLAPC
ncbi:hypothetical protein F4780DRAFT_726635 [Xylariomycetidae sp. FL0641]|nr:hypothetical protein F4780DRAFT_726635 [Xylariomycetidae sp. FL0641]